MFVLPGKPNPKGNFSKQTTKEVFYFLLLEMNDENVTTKNIISESISQNNK